MKFIDEATIIVKAGDGGPGARSFRREKFVPLGGPDGGNGGAGGSVIIRADTGKHTLLDFSLQPKWKAANGKAGGGANKDGKTGEDLTILVPVGTQLFNDADGELVIDLHEAGKEFVLKGGRGGKGNSFFKTSTNQAPEHHQPGEPGEGGTYLLSLKLVADVGLIGLPNAGKSTLISRISAARPKIADYPFTTLTPNLGVVRAKGNRTFVVADIPGLIPGASEGKGLGTKFLKHVERTSALAHLIDPLAITEDGEPLDPLDSFTLINKELTHFSPEMAARRQVVVLTKADALESSESSAKTKQAFEKMGVSCISISSVTGEGIEELIELLAGLAGR